MLDMNFYPNELRDVTTSLLFNMFLRINVNT